jgi:hypothetical protein
MAADRWVIDPNRVVWELLDGEAVIVDLAAGHYHAATGVAATVWAAVAEGHDLDTIVATATARHEDAPATAEADISAFLGQLIDAGLVAPAADAAPAGSSPAPATGPTLPWSRPVLESHDDLEDLLLLDPVHDVSSDGWPNAAVGPAAE